MDFGVGLLNYPGCWDDAAFAEQHGFVTAGFVDSPLNNGDPFVSMALAAKETQRMRLGTFVNVPSLRNAATTASALSTVNSLAPGRVFYGTGTGDTGRGTFGIPAMSASKVREYASNVRDLLVGRDVIHRHADRETLVRRVNAAQIQTNVENPIPIYMAADGPKAFQVAGEFADGWIATLAKQGAGTMTNSPEAFESSLTAIRENATNVGRNFDNRYTIWTTAVCVLEPGESAISPRALAQTGPMATFPFHAYGCHPEIGRSFPPVLQERLAIYEKDVLARLDLPRERFYQAVHAGHLSHLLDGEAAVLTEEIVRMTTLTGTAEEIADVLSRMETQGLANVTLWAPPAALRHVVLDVESKVMPLLTPSAAGV